MTTAMVDTPSRPSRPQLWRITDRRSFGALRQHGRRVRRGPLTVTFLPPRGVEELVPPRVAFAVGAAVGGAVIRNRIRRRLRAALRALLVAERLPRGDYLISAGAEVARVASTELARHLEDAVDAATGPPR